MIESEQANSKESTDRTANISVTLGAVSFWVLGTLLAFFLAAASAPSPLYGVYQKLWHFSPVVLTEIYAVYALGALVALLTTGRLSDHLGRRPVLLIALLIQIAGMAAFIAAHGVEMLFIGRVLQGIGTGIASGAISAWLLDLQPADNPKLGSIVGGIAPMAGLATGALVSGLLVQYGPDPQQLIFWVMLVIYALAVPATLIMPDRVQRVPGWLQSMRPQIGVPSAARSLFAVMVPSLVAIWALAGLYLSLGPSLAIALLHSESRVAGGLVVVALMGAGAVASTMVRMEEARMLVIKGSLLLVIGVGLTLLAVVFRFAAGLYAGSFIAGLGFGPAFSGVFRSLAPLAPLDKRSALVSSIYIAIYVSFSIPAVLAGVAVGRFGLINTALGFGLVVMALGTMTTVAVSRRREAA
jgi:MFS family permease